MRLLPRPRTTVCPSCATVGPPTARWCGRCGTSLQAPPALVPSTDDDAARSLPTAPTPRRWRGAALVMGLLLAAVLAAPRTSGLDGSAAGRLELSTGRSSDLAPAGRLQLLWARPLEAEAASGPPPAVTAVGPDAVRIGDTVRSMEDGRVLSVGLPAPGPDGLVALADQDAVVLVDARTGAVELRAPVPDGSDWPLASRPAGWVDGGALFVGSDERVRRVDVDPVSSLARVTWALPEGVDLVSAAPGWLVAVDRRAGPPRYVTVSAADGAPAADLGPVGPLAAPVVVGDVVVGLTVDDAPALVGRGTASGEQLWRTDLGQHPSLRFGAAPAALELVAVDDVALPRVAVQGRSAGDGWSVVTFGAGDGSQLSSLTMRAGEDDADGWRQVGFTGSALVHLDPYRGELRRADLGGTVRWAIDADAAEVISVGPELTLLRSPASDGLLVERLRIVDGATGTVLQDRLDGGARRMLLVAAAGADAVVVRPADGDGSVLEDGWYDLATGRRTAGVTAVERALRDVEVTPRHTLLGFLGATGDTPVVLENGVDVSWLHVPGGTPVPVHAGVSDVGVMGGGDAVVFPGLAYDTAWVVGVDDGSVVRLERFVPRAMLDDRVLGLDADTSELVAVGLADGTPAWRGPAVPHDAAVLTGEGRVVVVARLSVTGLDALTGEVRWRAALPSPAVPGAAALLRGPLVVIGADGRVHALDTTDGALAWSSASGTFVTTITGAGGQVVAGTADGRLLVLDGDGRVVQELSAGTDAVEDVLVSDGTVVATVGSGLVGYGRGRLFVEPPDRVELP